MEPAAVRQTPSLKQAACDGQETLAYQSGFDNEFATEALPVRCRRRRIHRNACPMVFMRSNYRAPPSPRRALPTVAPGCIASGPRRMHRPFRPYRDAHIIGGFREPHATRSVALGSAAAAGRAGRFRRRPGDDGGQRRRPRGKPVRYLSVRLHRRCRIAPSTAPTASC